MSVRLRPWAVISEGHHSAAGHSELRHSGIVNCAQRTTLSLPELMTCQLTATTPAMSGWSGFTACFCTLRNGLYLCRRKKRASGMQWVYCDVCHTVIYELTAVDYFVNARHRNA